MKKLPAPKKPQANGSKHVNGPIASQAGRGRRRAGPRKQVPKDSIFLMSVRTGPTLTSHLAVMRGPSLVWLEATDVQETFGRRQCQGPFGSAGRGGAGRNVRRAGHVKPRAPHCKTFGMCMLTQAIATAVACSLAPPGEDFDRSSTACASPSLSY